MRTNHFSAAAAFAIAMCAFPATQAAQPVELVAQAKAAGEKGDGGSTEVPAKMTKEQREQARAERKAKTAAEGKANEMPKGESGAAQTAQAAPAKKLTKEERDAARAARLKKTAAESKAGQISKGEAQ